MTVETTPTGTELVERSLVDGVLTLTLNQPASMNAVTVPMLEALAGQLSAAAADEAVRVVVLAGRGRAFCAGADLGDGDGLGEGLGALVDAVNGSIRAIRTAPQPVVALVRGPAAGAGVSLALACDLVLASESAYFLLAFTRVGLMPDGGATALVAASVGRARAMRMALLADRLPAADAERAGLIAAAWPEADFDERSGAVLASLSGGPARAFARTKDAINEATLGGLENAFTVERAGQLSLARTGDFAEGVAAFHERRPARFTGR